MSLFYSFYNIFEPILFIFEPIHKNFLRYWEFETFKLRAPKTGTPCQTHVFSIFIILSCVNLLSKFFFVQFFSNYVKKGNFPGMGNSPGMSHIPREYYGNGNEIFKAEIVIFPGMGYSRGMGMRPHGNGNSRTSHISAYNI